MIDYIISGILVVFIIAVLVYLRRRERTDPPEPFTGPGGSARRRKQAEHNKR
ncbi:MAG TPA: hypothetical protein VIH64_04390 [Streptosporangiaceae bacterium]